MKGRRLDRVGHLIQMELSELILHRVKDPRLGFVTVTHVDVTSDLRSAGVFVSIMGSPEEKKDSLQALQKAAGFLQREINKNLELRFTPKLLFRIDPSIDRGLEIDTLLGEIKKKEGPGS